MIRDHLPQNMKTWTQRLRAKAGPHAVILTYHRIADDQVDPYGLCVTPDHFAQQLQVLRDQFRAMPLAELVNHMRQGRLPKGAVCVTFDDGYMDNLLIAKPLLERYEIPATVFMTTGSVGRQREFWWDELERIILRPSQRPKTLNLHMADQPYTWELADAAIYREADMQRDHHWRLQYPGEPHTTADPTPRHRAFREVYHLIQPMNDEQRNQVLDQLIDWSGQSSTVRPTHQALDMDGIRQLAKGKCVAIGAHTVSHPALPVCSIEVQRDEIRQSKVTLEETIGCEIKSFSYPYGRYSDQTVDFVKEIGFEYACACEEQPVRCDHNRLLLPRIEAGNWDGDQFANVLINHIQPTLASRLAGLWGRTP